ncbi:MAG: FAD:protein FMN transferase, partial [Aquirufa sp.]
SRKGFEGMGGLSAICSEVYHGSFCFSVMHLFQRTDLLMGNRFDLGVVAEHESDAKDGLTEAVLEIKRIEGLLTTFNESSQTFLINENAGIAPVEVDQEVYDLIARAQKISHLTQGAFDLSYGSLDKRFWNFDQQMTELPSPEKLAESVRLIDYQAIELNPENRTVFLRNKGMRIGFGGIGKGYAADQAKKRLRQLGFQNGVVNASGDMSAWGMNEHGMPWQVAIVDPDDATKTVANFDLKDAAVATSGNYEKFV